MLTSLPSDLHERIRLVREYCGLKKVELAGRIGFSKTTYSSIESGRQRPSLGLLARMADETLFPISFFMNRESHRQVRADRTPITFHGNARTTRVELKQAEAVTELVSRVWRGLAKQCELPIAEFPDSPLTQDLSEADVEMAAQTLRKAWGLGDGPISKLTALIESHGVWLTKVRLPYDLDAFSTWDGTQPLAIFGRRDTTAARDRFSLAHEMGHLSLHRGVSSEQMTSPDQRAVIEEQANRFAEAFLLPAQSFGQEFRSTSFACLLELQLRWRVSMRVISLRARSLGLLRDRQAASIFQQLSRRRDDPLDDTLELEAPQILRKAIENVQAQNPKGREALVESLCMSEERFSELTGTSLNKET